MSSRRSWVVGRRAAQFVAQCRLGFYQSRDALIEGQFTDCCELRDALLGRVVDFAHGYEYIPGSTSSPKIFSPES